MRTVKVIPLQKGRHLLRQIRYIACSVFAPPQALAPNRAVKTLNETLLVFLVRSCYSVAVAVAVNDFYKRSLELRPAPRLFSYLTTNYFECLFWVGGKITPCRCDIGVSIPPQKRNRRIAKGCHNVRHVPDPNGACVLAHRHIPHIMNPVLNRPMTMNPVLNRRFCVGSQAGQTRHAVPSLAAWLACFLLQNAPLQTSPNGIPAALRRNRCSGGPNQRYRPKSAPQPVRARN